ncbi:thioredoxin family protein [Paenibacillus mendelii]|uniref:Thioredoxin n=1 Tax=Paenibacillus mendelii TaxID=206163 RepID=A0ABV6JIX3_9BACL|nr:thioredoxin domain-containing protein [Paenibacillus mendelii]
MALMQAESNERLKEIVREGVVLVDYVTAWCPPCKTLLPILEEIDEEMTGRVRIVKVDCEQLPESAVDAGIMGTPTVIVYHEGQAVEKLVGLRPKSQYQAVLEKYVSGSARLS